MLLTRSASNSTSRIFHPIELIYHKHTLYKFFFPYIVDGYILKYGCVNKYIYNVYICICSVELGGRDTCLHYFSMTMDDLALICKVMLHSVV